MKNITLESCEVRTYVALFHHFGGVPQGMSHEEAVSKVYPLELRTFGISIMRIKHRNSPIDKKDCAMYVFFDRMVGDYEPESGEEKIPFTSALYGWSGRHYFGGKLHTRDEASAENNLALLDGMEKAGCDRFIRTSEDGLYIPFRTQDVLIPIY